VVIEGGGGRDLGDILEGYAPLAALGRPPGELCVIFCQAEVVHLGLPLPAMLHHIRPLHAVPLIREKYLASLLKSIQKQLSAHSSHL